MAKPGGFYKKNPLNYILIQGIFFRLDSCSIF